MIGFGAVALLPTLASVVGFQLIRRAGNFAIARPTREVLFTVLPREDRYKAKSFIDTAVYRLGDQIGAWSFALLTYARARTDRGLDRRRRHFGLWLANSWWLGRRQDVLARQQAIDAGGSERDASVPRSRCVMCRSRISACSRRS